MLKKDVENFKNHIFLLVLEIIFYPNIRSAKYTQTTHATQAILNYYKKNQAHMIFFRKTKGRFYDFVFFIYFF